MLNDFLEDFDSLELRDRFKGSPWFPKENEEKVTVYGSGGIGSWLSLFVSRIGYNTQIVDDDVVERHNLGGQFFKDSQINSSKVGAVVQNCIDFGADTSKISAKINRVNRILNISNSGIGKDIVCLCFDNMQSRKNIFCSLFAISWIIPIDVVMNRASIYHEVSESSFKDFSNILFKNFFENEGDLGCFVTVCDEEELLHAYEKIDGYFFVNTDDTIENHRLTQGEFSELSLEDKQYELSNIIISISEQLNDLKPKDHFIFVDGRLEAEQLQVFSFDMSEKSKILEYYNNNIFSDDSIEDEVCSFKQTSHVASMIASIMTCSITNHIFNNRVGRRIRKVPFKIEYTVSNSNFQKEEVL